MYMPIFIKSDPYDIQYKKEEMHKNESYQYGFSNGFLMACYIIMFLHLVLKCVYR
jgi:hypothetical protein